MPRAFILEPHELDTRQAEKYGPIEYVFDKGERRSSIWSGTFLDEISARLREKQFDPCDDYFVVVGHMVPIMLTAMRILSDYSRVRMLLFSATERDYVLREIKYGPESETHVQRDGVTARSLVRGHEEDTRGDSSL